MIGKLTGAAIFAAFFLVSPWGALAQDVTLTSRDGAVEVSGTLLSFDGEFYRVETRYGQLTLDGQAVNCEGPGCPRLEDYVAEFSFSGARSMGSVLLPALIESFAERRGLKVQRTDEDTERFRYVLTSADTGADVARIGFRLSTTSEGFADLLAGEADLVMATREVRPDEVDMVREAGLGNLRAGSRSRIVALDALVPIVADSNPLRDITVQQLTDLLSGAVTQWPDGEEPVNIQARAPGVGLSQLVHDRLLAPVDAVLTQAEIHDSDESLAAAVARDRWALAVTRQSETGNARVLRLGGDCGMSPRLDRRSLKAEDYPFAAPLILYRPARRLPLFAREFLTYLSTPAAQIVVRRAGYVDQTREQIALDAQGERLANAIAKAGDEVTLSELKRMAAAMRGTVRLTTSFRFRGGSTAMDAQSSGNIDDLARALEAGVFDGRTLMFVGFSDGEGSAGANRRIAERRAQAVRDAVQAAALSADLSRVVFAAEGFGEAMPMACDDTEWGRHVNRRVEVWLR